MLLQLQKDLINHQITNEEFIDKSIEWLIQNNQITKDIRNISIEKTLINQKTVLDIQNIIKEKDHDIANLTCRLVGLINISS